MAFYTLVKPQVDSWHVQAGDRAEALSEFSRLLGITLTDKPTGQMEDYLLDEWTDGERAHLVTGRIHIWHARNG